MKKLWIFLLYLLALLSGCQSNPEEKNDFSDTRNAVTQACLPEITPDKIARIF
ncbi:MAG: lipoprotein [Oscillospiraceae bacterium]|nr:lipoprotein [Oscillospiraceae bacterium]